MTEQEMVKHLEGLGYTVIEPNIPANKELTRADYEAIRERSRDIVRKYWAGEI